MYHDRFSTSSYFMPSLYFKAHEVFAIEPVAQPASHRRFEVERLATTSSSDLVQRILDRKADLVAVWDGTKKKCESHPELLFIQIPTPVPNDFLVASGIDAATERLILDAITKHPEADRACTDLAVPARTVPIAGAEVRKPCERRTESADRRLRRVVRVGQQRQRSDRFGERGARQAAPGRAPAGRHQWW